jgi:hypothetical protein
MLLTFATDSAVTATLDDADRALTGLAVPFGVPGRTSAGLLTVPPGTVRVPADLRRVKLFTEHGRATPIGYATAAADDPAGLRMTFRVARTPDGDTALLEAAEGVRDALSVELDAAVVKAGALVSADLVGVAVTSVPAFADARLVASLAPDTDPEPDPEPPAAPPAPEPEDPPVPETPLPTGTLTAARPGPLTLHRAAGDIASAMMDNDIGRINAALTDIVPGNDAGGGFLQPQWLGELWAASATSRHFIDAMSHAVLTSGTTVKGWYWTAKPTVATYAGNKTEIPSSTATTAAKSAPVTRLAGGWDIDRIYQDLGEPGFMESCLAPATPDLAAKTEAAAAAALLAAATAAPDGGDVYSAMAAVVTELTAAGAAVNYLGLSPDLFAELLGGVSASVPWWLQAQGSVSIGGGTANVADLNVFSAPALPAATVLGGDRRAATYFEPSGNPVRVTAVNIPNGGIDLGVFSYSATLVNDPLGIAKSTVVVVP